MNKIESFGNLEFKLADGQILAPSHIPELKKMLKLNGELDSNNRVLKKLLEDSGKDYLLLVGKPLASWKRINGVLLPIETIRPKYHVERKELGVVDNEIFGQQRRDYGISNFVLGDRSFQGDREDIFTVSTNINKGGIGSTSNVSVLSKVNWIYFRAGNIRRYDSERILVGDCGDILKYHQFMKKDEYIEYINREIMQYKLKYNIKIKNSRGEANTPKEPNKSDIVMTDPFQRPSLNKS